MVFIRKDYIQDNQDWEEQNQRVISLLNIARISILFSLLIFLSIIHNLGNTSSTATYMPMVQNEKWLQIWCIAYSIIIMTSLAKPSWQLQNTRSIPNSSAMIDITMMAILTALAGGVSSGFGILVLPFLATASLLSYGRFSLFYSSYTTISILIDVFSNFNDTPISSNLPLLTGQILLIAACYLVPLLTSFSARYLVRADVSLQHHRTAYERLSALNKIVLNRVQEAVIVVDSTCHIWLHNRQAVDYFPDIRAGEVAEFTQSLVKHWRTRPHTEFEQACEMSKMLMHVRAIPIIQENTELLMLFIRSDRERQIEAQTLKLTSLGLLTANLAHEIRNPLSAMRQASGLLQETAEEINNPVLSRLSSIVEKNIARIDKMIEEVSSLNKRDRVNPQVIHIMNFWLHFSQEFYLTHPNAKGCLKIDMPKEVFEVIFDEMHLQQILWNLCNNAWRHCHKEKDSVIISIRHYSSKHVALRVWDDGTGVPESVQTHLFEPFHTTQAEGTGLGLYVARELAHANKGDLQYLPHSKSFELILPRHRNDNK